MREATRPTTAPRRGWSVLALALASAALGALFAALNHFQPAGGIPLLFNLVFSLAFVVSGAVLVGYRPANPIGWILSAMGLAEVLSEFLVDYGQYAIRTNPGSVPGGRARAVAAEPGLVSDPWAGAAAVPAGA